MRFREVHQVAEAMDDRPLVGRNGMRAVLVRGAQVVQRGLASFRVQRNGLEHDVGLRRCQPLVDVPALGSRGRRAVHAAGVGEPTHAP